MNMVQESYFKLISLHKNIKLSNSRSISKYIQKDICAKVIRQRFLDYFIKENDHIFVKSSPVIPYCDPTLAFVNAGMNQFKGILLGTQVSEYKKVANSQKCVRVGGKHNDLNVVGNDGYHHTFFEMLGNWSFADYFKTDACNYAWDLLINVYKIPKSRLYVTYFKGDNGLGITEDLETKEIWRQIGVPETRILPFGLKDNFWEMGITGPCGPCTEIHFDHLGTNNRSEFVNKDLHDLTEIWNIVFIECNREADGSISSLPRKHVDTGMGFERLTSVLQGKISNYDTDNFQYLLEAIHKNCSSLPKYRGTFGENDWNSIDTSYRILADHIRTITACLADGVIPEENQKLRRILRKTFLISETVFKKDRGLIKELTNYVIENLGPIYPEMERNITQIHQIINYEEEVYKSTRQSAIKDWEKLTTENHLHLENGLIETPSFITAYKELISVKPKEIDGKLAFKLFDTYGLDEDSIIKLCKMLNIIFSPEELNKELDIARMRSKEANILLKNDFSLLNNENIPKTNDSFKYTYYKSNMGYTFSDVEVKVLKIFQNNAMVPQIEKDIYCSLLLDKTNMYSEAGGQISDKGSIDFGNGLFDIVTLENVNGYIFHKGFFKSKTSNLKTNMIGSLKVDEEYRLNCMRNHTTTHLLNAALKEIKGATCQKSSKVTDKFLNFDVAIFSDKLRIDEISKIEELIMNIIKNGRQVVINEINSQKLLNYDYITLIPGEVYPDKGIRIVEIKDNSFVSREPCCGTHVLSTSDIEDFCITNLKSLGRSTASISAVTGSRAKLAKFNAIELMEEIDDFTKSINDNMDKPELLDIILSNLKQKLNYSVEDESLLPYIVKHHCTEKLRLINKEIKGTARENLRDFIEIEMQNALESKVATTKSNKKYIVHYLRSSMILESVPLQKATKLCSDIPILVISYAGNMVKARCCVPKSFKNDRFNAEKWMQESVASVFRSRAVSPKGQDGTLVCNMKSKKVHLQEWDPLLNESLEKAKKFVEENL